MPIHAAGGAAVPAGQGTGVLSWLKQIWGRFTGQHADLAAAAVALFGLLAMVPAMLLAVWLFVVLVAHSTDRAWALLSPHLSQLVAGASSSRSGNLLLSTVHGMLASHAAAGLVGVLGLVWSGSRIFNIITEAFNEAWRVNRGRNFLKQNIMSVLMLLVVGGIFVISVGATACAGLLVGLFGRMVGHGIAAPLGLAVSIVVNLATNIALFVVTYKWAPNRRVDWRPALFGGIIGGALWTLFQQVFRYYLAHFAQYNQAYGAMGAMVILILWAYYSAYILLLGAVACAVYSERVLGDTGADATTEAGPPTRQERAKQVDGS